MMPGMLPRSAEAVAFWQAFRRCAGLDHDNYVVGLFGDSPDMATELAELVIAGPKRATASLARDYEAGAPMPKPGDFVVMLDGQGHPRFIWRTTEVTVKPMSEGRRPICLGRGRGRSHASVVARRPPPLFRAAGGSGRVRIGRRNTHRVRALRGRVAARSYGESRLGRAGALTPYPRRVTGKVLPATGVPKNGDVADGPCFEMPAKQRSSYPHPGGGRDPSVRFSQFIE
jgi:uncharacterized protein YhfF